MSTDLAGVHHVVLDMDGTIYLGGTLLPHTLPFLSALARLGIGHSFITNNCSRSRGGVRRAPASARHRLAGRIDFDFGPCDDSLS